MRKQKRLPFQNAWSKGLLWGLLLPLFALAGKLQAQECVINMSMGSESPTPILRNEQTIQNETKTIELAPNPLESLSLTGELTFTAREGYFKAVLHDSKGKLHLVYRDVAALNTLNQKIHLQNACYETAFLNGATPAKLEILAEGCSFQLKEVGAKHSPLLTKSLSPLELQQQQEFQANTLKVARMETIERINAHNRKNGVLWAAGETSLSEAPYEVWRTAFGTEADELETYGWQYYKGGVLSYMDIDYDSLVFYEDSIKDYVEYFDWSNRHGINWNSKIRNQMFLDEEAKRWEDTGTCWAQGPLSAFEAFINLYTGRKIDVALSLKELVACSDGIEIDGKTKKYDGGYVSDAVSYVARSGLMSEADFPFDHKQFMEERDNKIIEKRCNQKPSPPHIWYQPKESKWIHFQNDKEEHTEIMAALLKYGPSTISVYEKEHAMSLVGWGMLKPGLFLEYWPDGWQPISVDEKHPMANKIYWIIKNSCGEGWGYNGYACMVRAKSKYERIPRSSKYPRGQVSFGEMYVFTGQLEYKVDGKETSIPKVAFDDDKDGYYRWGLGGKPDVLPPSYKGEDADDSDPNIREVKPYGHADRFKKYDLYMRDREEDKGVEPFLTDKPIWESPDIWIRKENDNGTEHETPNYDGSKPFYVKIRIHNRGEAPSSRHARVYLRWSQAGITLSRDSFLGLHKLPSNAGDSLATGGFVTGVPIPIIQPGESTIVTIEITKENIPPPARFTGYSKDTWHYCLLAEIMALDDPYHKDSDPSSLGNYVPHNNNVVQKNVQLIEYFYMPLTGALSENKLGATVYLSNDQKDKVAHYELLCYEEPIAGESLTHEAELFLIPDEKLLQAIELGGQQLVGMEQMPTLQSTVIIDGIPLLFQESPIKVNQKNARIGKVTLQPGETARLSVRANFLTEKMTDNKNYKYIVAAKDKETGKIIGGETFLIKKTPRYNVIAALEAINPEENGGKRFKAKPLSEEATYTWRNEAGRAVAQGLTVSSDSLVGVADLTLEVTALRDGFKDYSSIDVQQAEEIAQLAITPNPVKEYLEISYEYAEGGNYSLVITGIAGNTFQYPVNTKEKPTRIYLNALPVGSYTLALRADNKTVATGKFTKE